MYEEKMHSALSSNKQRLKGQDNSQNNKQVEARRLVTGLEIELDSCHVQYLHEIGYLEHKLFQSENNCDTTTKGTQTETIAVKRDVELVLKSDVPKREMAKRKITKAGGTQTEVDEKVFEFVTYGSQRFEQILKGGYLKGIEFQNNPTNMESQTDYLIQLV